MAVNPTQLPAYIQLRYEENGVFSRFENDAVSAAKRSSDQFSRAFAETSKAVTDSLNRATSTAGKIDLGVGDLKKQVADIRLYREAMAQTERAANDLAIRTGDTTRATNEYLRSLSEQRGEADRALKAAEAQVNTYSRLQTVLDATAASNSNLAKSQRAVVEAQYAQEAAAAKQQLASGGDRQELYTAGFGYNDRATDNGATTSAFAQQAAMDELRRAEVGAAEGTRILAAAHAETTLALDRTTKSARDSAAVFEAAAREEAQLAAATAQLRGQLDPTFIAQQRFDRELANADRLLKAGEIGTREYAQAQQLARDNLRQSHAAIFQTNTALAAGGRANHEYAASTRGVRQASVQTGQQLQDLGISLYSGQRASTVFAQQLPQLAFALTSLEGSTNKTLAATGRFAAVLSGPLGSVALVAASVGLGVLVERLFFSEKATDGAARSVSDHVSELKKQAEETVNSEQAQALYGQTIDGVREAIELQRQSLEELNDSYKTKAQLDLEAANLNALVIAQQKQRIEANLAEAESLLEIRKAQLGDPNQNQAETINEIVTGGPQAIARIRAELARIDADIANADRNVSDAYARRLTELGQRSAEDILNERYDSQVRAAQNAAVASGKVTAALQAEVQAIEAARDAELERLRATERQPRAQSTRTPLPAVTLSEVSGILERELGAVIGSTTRSAKQNRDAGGAANSYHLFSQAIDLPFSRGHNAEITPADIRRVLAAEGIDIRELLSRGDKDHDDHTHVAFSRKRLTPDQVARGDNRAEREAERRAVAAAKETERLAAVSDQSAEAIARVNEQFDDQPRLVDQSARAVRRLQGIIGELNATDSEGNLINADVPRRAELVAEAIDAQAQAARAVTTEIERYEEANKRNLQILDLQAAGLFDQAEIMSEIQRLDDQFGLSSRAEKLQEEADSLRDILQSEQLTAEQRAATQAVLEASNAELDGIEASQARISDEVRFQVQQERLKQQQIARTNALIGAQLDVLSTARGGLLDVLSGRSTDFFGDLKQSIADLQGARLFDDLFGDVFDQLENEFRQNTPLGKAEAGLAKSVDATSTEAMRLANGLGTLTDTVVSSAQAIEKKMTFDEAFAPGTRPFDAAESGNTSTRVQALKPLIRNPANDNDGTIVVTGERRSTEIAKLSVTEIADRTAAGIVGPLLQGFDDIFGTSFMQQLSGVLEGALSGYIRAGETGGVLGGLKGLNGQFGEGLFGRDLASRFDSLLGTGLLGAQTGSQVNGIMGALGLGGSRTGSQLGGALGSFLPIPGGDLIGSIAGGLLGGLFKKKPYGTASISNLDGLSVRGRGEGSEAGASALGGSVQDGLKRILDALDAELGSFSVSIGTYKDNFRVSTRGDTGKLGGYKGSEAENERRYGLYNFATEAEAIAFAIGDAIKDGAIKGLKAAEQRLIAANKDIEAAVRDVLDFRNVFKELKRYKDPVGAALDDLNSEFERLIDLFGRAGASSAELAQLEELYGLKRAEAIEQATSQVTSALKDLLNDLRTGDNGLSLRTRRANTLDDFNGLAERVQAGDTSAYDEFASVARNLLDIERELYGSTQDYFNRLGEITDLTAARVQGDANISPIGTNYESPFDERGLTKDAIMDQTNTLADHLRAQNDNIIRSNQLLESIEVKFGGGRFNPAQTFQAF